jgi:transposase
MDVLSTLTVAVLYGWIISANNALVGRWVMVLATMALLAMMAFSGSRGAMAQSALVFVATAIAGVVYNRRQLAIRAGLWPLMMLVFLVVLWPIMLPNAYDMFITRWDQAAAVSPFALGFFGRALCPLYAWIYYLNTPFNGYLLGIGTNAAARVSWVQMPEAAYTWTGYGIWARESGFAVHLVELGLVLGFGYILFRIWFTLWLLIKVWKSTRKNHDPLALMLFSFAGELILMGQITVQGTVNGYTWIFLGVTLAAAKFTSVKNDGKGSSAGLGQ